MGKGFPFGAQTKTLARADTTEEEFFPHAIFLGGGNTVVHFQKQSIT